MNTYMDIVRCVLIDIIQVRIADTLVTSFLLLAAILFFCSCVLRRSPLRPILACIISLLFLSAYNLLPLISNQSLPLVCITHNTHIVCKYLLSQSSSSTGIIFLTVPVMPSLISLSSSYLFIFFFSPSSSLVYPLLERLLKAPGHWGLSFRGSIKTLVSSAGTIMAFTNNPANRTQLCDQ